MNKFVVAATAAFSLAGTAAAVPATIRTAAETVSGDVKWQPGSKTYSLTKGNMRREFPQADVKGLDVPRPQALDRAAAMIRGGQTTGAIQLLSGLVAEYRMLRWDKSAVKLLVEAYLKSSQPQKAYDAANAAIADDKSAAWTGEIAPVFWEALLKLGKKNALEQCLDKAASSGGREASAHALVMRGDIIRAEGGDNTETYRKALVDGYLRVAFMYEDVVDARIKALEKGAECLAQIGMPSRAEAFRAKARQLAGK